MPSDVRIGVSELIGASKAYVEDRVRKANVNGNPYLTKEEAKKLPADLRDNFEAHRVKGNANSRVAVRQFTQAFVKYVAVKARAADANRDGFLSSAEARKLPKDLRDNFVNYVRATRGTDRGGESAMIAAGRKALADYVNDVLFNPRNAAGKDFRDEVLSWRTPAEQAKAKNDMLEEAQRWTPAGWEKFVDGATTTWGGRFFQLYTEVKFPAHGKPSVYVEID